MTIRRVVVDHVDFLVPDLQASRQFYTAALAPLGFVALECGASSVAFGVDGADDFGINLIAEGDAPTVRAHVAFVAETREAVDAFYEAALRAGGREKEAPALRPEYHSGYYAAFVYDPCGNNIEAVYHGPLNVTMQPPNEEMRKQDTV
jgi:catechol 2,3-dioxygenase-like lactoylglutathione lyase family enzyme